MFGNRIKRHICVVKNSRLGHDIPISVKDRVILPFRECFNFTKLRIFPKIKPSLKFPNLQYVCTSFCIQQSVYDSQFSTNLEQ